MPISMMCKVGVITLFFCLVTSEAVDLINAVLCVHGLSDLQTLFSINDRVNDRSLNLEHSPFQFIVYKFPTRELCLQARESLSAMNVAVLLYDFSDQGLLDYRHRNREIFDNFQSLLRSFVHPRTQVPIPNQKDELQSRLPLIEIDARYQENWDVTLKSSELQFQNIEEWESYTGEEAKKQLLQSFFPEGHPDREAVSDAFNPSLMFYAWNPQKKAGVIFVGECHDRNYFTDMEASMVGATQNRLNTIFTESSITNILAGGENSELSVLNSVKHSGVSLIPLRDPTLMMGITTPPAFSFEYNSLRNRKFNVPVLRSKLIKDARCTDLSDSEDVRSSLWETRYSSWRSVIESTIWIRSVMHWNSVDSAVEEGSLNIAIEGASHTLDILAELQSIDVSADDSPSNAKLRFLTDEPQRIALICIYGLEDRFIAAKLRDPLTQRRFQRDLDHPFKYEIKLSDSYEECEKKKRTLASFIPVLIYDFTDQQLLNIRGHSRSAFTNNQLLFNVPWNSNLKNEKDDFVKMFSLFKVDSRFDQWNPFVVKPYELISFQNIEEWESYTGEEAKKQLLQSFFPEGHPDREAVSDAFNPSLMFYAWNPQKKAGVIFIGGDEDGGISVEMETRIISTMRKQISKIFTPYSLSSVLKLSQRKAIFSRWMSSLDPSIQPVSLCPMMDPEEFYSHLIPTFGAELSNLFNNKPNGLKLRMRPHLLNTHLMPELLKCLDLSDERTLIARMWERQYQFFFTDRLDWIRSMLHWNSVVSGVEAGSLNIVFERIDLVAEILAELKGIDIDITKDELPSNEHLCLYERIPETKEQKRIFQD